ncbi:MAG: LTA synthase family protein [Butyricicoccus sp.]|nr:LTA synthase family protein [Butyricicoccus sp.]
MKLFHSFRREGKSPSRRDFLFGRVPAPTTGWKIASILWSTAILAAICFALGHLALYYGAGDYRMPMYESYFEIEMLPLLNFLPIFWLGGLLWFLLGRAGWAAALTAIITMGFTMANVLKISVRNDPLLAIDLTFITEAGNMMGQYELSLSRGKLLGIAIAVVLAVLALWLAHYRLPGKVRIAGLLLWLALGAGLWNGLYLDDDLYASTANDDLINPWAEAQVYQSRGFVYSFLRSVPEAIDSAPEGYDKKQAAAILEAYTDTDIPADKQVSIIGIMLEAYTDLTEYPQFAAAEPAYTFWHELQNESYTGHLVADIFAGGTVYTERSFLTGLSEMRDFRTPTNSFVHYLSAQGYETTGSHPNYEWFYNRANVNEYLGFDEYLFYDDHYKALIPKREGITLDSDLKAIPEIGRLYLESEKPCFSFSVTYQNHGPYAATDDAAQRFFTPAATGWSAESCNILNHYLSGLANTDRALREMVDALRTSAEPTVLVLFGDHKPWLGASSSVYYETGLDPSENLMDGYATPYLFWANDAARDVLGCDLTGDAPTISPCFLMNELFDRLGWEGSAYMQYTDTVRARLPVIHTSGLYLVDGTLTDTLSAEDQAILDEFRCVQYYYRRNFFN